MNRAAICFFAVLLEAGRAGAAAPAPAAARPAPAAASGACGELVRAYDTSNRKIAQIRADGVLDNSAPRETNRQLKELNERQEQLVVLELMRMRNCPAPLHGGPAPYMTSAMECALETEKGNYKAEICDISKWTLTESSAPAP
ncbi:MAG TPA: hypothetical protein VG889_04245 [Rhizomicrobium sp.]|nr:hypothetical protein [Rhizomicrobium sp.]